MKTFDYNGAIAFTIKNGNDWLPLTDIARHVYGDTQRKTVTLLRRYLWRMRIKALKAGILLLSDGDVGSGHTANLKVFDPNSEDDRRHAATLLTIMRSKEGVSAHCYCNAERVILDEASWSPLTKEMVVGDRAEERAADLAANRAVIDAVAATLSAA
jgi:hypothetical protein